MNFQYKNHKASREKRTSEGGKQRVGRGGKNGRYADGKENGRTHHFIVNLVEVDFANFIYNVLALKCDKSETWNREKTNAVVIVEVTCSFRLEEEEEQVRSVCRGFRCHLLFV